MRRITAQYQTQFGEWRVLPEPRQRSDGQATLCEWTLPPFAIPAMVSWRVQVDDQCQTLQQWSLLHIREHPGG
jgi:hypothetical protein